MLEVLIETTKWDVDYKQPNHIYLVRDNKLLGSCINGVVKYYKKPLMFDRSRRKFTKGYMNIFGDYKEPEDKNIIKIQGSKGNVYEVNVMEKTCTCSAFKFRSGMCKHLKEVLK